MAKESKEISLDIVTPVGIAQYPSLSSPDTRFDEMGTYKVNLIIPASEAKDLITEIDNVLEERKETLEEELTPAKFKKAVQAVRVPYEMEEDDDGNETGNVIFKFKCSASFKSKKDNSIVNKKLTLVDAKKKKVEANVGAGSKLKVAAQIRSYYVAALGLGVSARLEAVQIIDLVEFSGGGKAIGMFDEEDGYEGETEENVADAFDTAASEQSGADL